MTGTKNTKRQPRRRVLAINRCPKHPEFFSVCIEDEDGSGTRITPSKCCGEWSTFKTWSLSANNWREIARSAEEAAEELEAAEVPHV